ncbi:hypothetical protein BH23PLA1_BH23PLA1_35590 [soil metagenome]
MNAPDDRPPILGLDLGTSTCLACVIWEGRPRFIRPDIYYRAPGKKELDYPGDVMPSAFCFRDGQSLVGHRALNELTDPRYAGDVVQQVKRMMKEEGSDLRIYSEGKPFTPARITGEYVKVLVRAAEIELGLEQGTIKKAVATVPATFGSKEQAATVKACVDYGGLREVELIDEPVAAAYSMGLHEQPGRRRVLVVDLGGGTFDLTLWDVGKGAGPRGFAELGRDGDSELGGLDWDREIADWTLRASQPRFPEAVFERLMREPTDYGHAKLFQACEVAKLTLSMQMKGQGLADPAQPIDPRRLESMHIAFRPSTEPGEVERSADMPSEIFLKQNQRLLKQCIHVCERLFHDIQTIRRLERFGWADIDCVYLAGGGSRLPTVQRRFAEAWGSPPVLDENPQHAVARGAALLAELWRQGQNLPGFVGKVRYKRSIGLLVRSRSEEAKPKFHPIIPRNQELPFDRSEFLPIVGDPNKASLCPLWYCGESDLPLNRAGGRLAPRVETFPWQDRPGPRGS